MKSATVINVLFVSVSILCFSCKKHSDTQPNVKFNVMFVNGCIGMTYMYGSVDGKMITVDNDLPFLTNTGYQIITTDSVLNFGYQIPGSYGSGENIIFTAGQSYSVFLGGSLTSGVDFSYSHDDLSPPAAGMAKVRFINLSVDSLNLNCFISGQKLDSNVSFGIITPFSQIAATTSGDAVFLQDPSRPESAMLSGQSFESGQIYTVMLTGTLNGTLTSQLALTVINN